jgi:ribosome maturation factor RimP
MIAKSKVIALAEERMAALNKGLFIVDVSVSAHNVIHLEIDKTDGYVSIEDCMSVSRNVEHNLDREEADFELHVSSAGLDKPFRVLAQYQKNVGREVNVKFEDGSKLTAELVAATDHELTLRTERMDKVEGKKKKERIVETTVFPMNQIKETKIVITFK